ncbi:hypothetical protein GLE_0486 [Lysobacter enzymogenes]|uniref:Insertion element IS402-like domain-containing protein n=1 Tax=Lysobacter enzymogenes TaxID=69 RepID=A0A0S2DBE3_LYSEN|nr:hypothetical protein GLE_0486 [Lysobacter enzymogenes]
MVRGFSTARRLRAAKRSIEMHSPIPMHGPLEKPGEARAAARTAADDEAGFVRLSEHEWAQFVEVARTLIQLRPAEEDNTRRFVEAVLTVMSGRRFWAQLPSERFGKWYLHHHRNLRWLERGVWLALAQRGAFGSERSRQMIGFVERQRASLQRQRARRRARLLSKDG